MNGIIKEFKLQAMQVDTDINRAEMDIRQLNEKDSGND